MAACLDAVALFGCSCASESLTPVTGDWPGGGASLCSGRASAADPETLVLLAHWLSVVLVVRGTVASLNPLEFLVLPEPLACRVLAGRMGSAPLSVHRPSPLQALSNHRVEQNELVPAPGSFCSCSEAPAFQVLLRSLGWELGPFRSMRVSGEQSRSPEPGV